jgi:hypothetical protein
LGLTSKWAVGPVLVIVEDHRGVAENLLLFVICDLEFFTET